MRKLGFEVLFLAVFLAMLCVSPGAFAQTSGRCGNNVTYVLDDNGVLTISGTGAITSHPWVAGDVIRVVIGNGVTSIGNCAFSGCSSLTSVTIPDGVTSIGDQAFYNCTSLSTVTIPENVTQIGIDAFRGCSGLTSVTIPDSVTRLGCVHFMNAST